MKFLQKAEPENMTDAEIPGWDRDNHRKAGKRVYVMSVRELLDWTDVAGTGMAKCLQDYRRGQDLASLLEMRNTLVTMYALNEELLLRDAAEGAVKHRPGRE